jgi:hypothetical protein
MRQFVKIILIPYPQGDLLFEHKPVTINVAAIWEISMKREDEYFVELDPAVLNMIEKKYFGRSTTIKEIRINSNELKAIGAIRETDLTAQGVKDKN